ncbi:MAG TPA: carboxypeptidase regulatory-like domain-containing protein, partial [Thermoanaerobaculia bacterium]|nr:carboxypeptidase regulatory-like domain-containing protein [Thermoanaerobaculia bacterium]
VVMVGRGTVRGRVRYEDGTLPDEIQVVAYSPVFTTGVRATVFPDGSYEARDVPVGTVSLYASDRLGSSVYQTIEIATAGAVVERDLTILRLPVDEATGELRGTVYGPDGSTPVHNAYLALYANGELVGVERSAFDGGFDFGVVPAGIAEIEGFDGETGLAGVRVLFEVEADQVNDVDLILRDERGEVEGHVYRQTAQGLVPVVGAVVWVSGTPFNTVTDDQGHYRLDSVFAGSKSLIAADLDSGEQVSELVTVTDGEVTFRDLHFIEDFGDGGIVGEVLGFNGNPVPSAKVHIGAGERAWWHESITDPRGRFSIPDLRPGTYVLHAVAGDETNAIGATATVTIRYEGETPFVSIRFKKGTIRGRTVILDELGQKIGVTSLVSYRTTTVNEGLVNLNWNAETLESDEDGWFEIPDVLAGDYSMTITNAFHGTQSVSGSLEFHGDVAEHEIVFEQNGSIGGRVLDVDGETPVAGAVVHLRHPNFSDYDVVTDAEGRFDFGLVPPGGHFPIDVEVDQGAIFRRTRVWVDYDEYGQQMEVDVVLRAQGTASGWVETATGQPVPGATVTLREHAYPRRTLTQTADGEGYYSFTNVFAGRLSIEAQAPQLGGLGGKVVAPLSTEGEEVWSLIVLEGAGEIVGRVISPVDGQPVPSAQVTLYEYLGGVVDAVTADADGAFRFRLLSLGLYRIWVFDPTTGRHGALDTVPIDFSGQISGGDVMLEVRGEVDGHVYDPDGDLPIPGGTVRLSTDSLVHLVTYASSDADGYYEFLGIPEGDFDLRVREPQGRRDARGSGTISEEGERVTVDLRMQQVGTVSGTVWNPPGAPAAPFPNVNTVIRENGQVVGATLDNPYTFDGLVAGRKLSIEAYEIGGNHRGNASGKIVDAESVETIDVTMVPIGAVTVSVEDSFGAPVAGADLRLTSSGYYGRRLFSASTGGDGMVTFNGVGKGSIGAFVTNPVNGLRGSATGALELEDEQVAIQVTLEDAGSLSGRLLLADGLTPAADALVVVTVAGRTYQLRAELDGSFSFPSLPLGAWTLFGEEYFGDAASLEVRGTLAANGEAIALGDLVLDAADPEVTALSPLSGSRDLPLSSTVRVDFNEPIDTSRFSSSWFTFRKLSGSNISYSVAWSNGGTTATLTPNGSLANFTGYEVIVNQGIDLAGRTLKERVKTTFFTVDQVAPTVVDVLPRNGAVQVPVDTNLRVNFSEPVVLASLSGSALQLTDVATGQQVTTTWQLVADERLAIITPQTALATDATYQLLVQGVLDGSGNAMAPLVVTSFKTPDTIPPTIDAVDFPAGTSFVSGDDVPVTVTASDDAGVGRATVRVVSEGWEFTDTTAPWEVTALAPVVAAASSVTLEIEVADAYGNPASTQRTVDVSPAANGSAPTVSVGCAADGDHVLSGYDVTMELSAADDERLESLRLLVDGVEVERVSPLDAATASHTFTWQPPAGAAPGTSFAARLEGRDFAGNVGAVDLAFAVPTGTVESLSQSLFAADYDGESLTLAGGTFIVQEPLDLASLTLLGGAELTGPTAGAPLRLTVAGEVQVQCGTRVDLDGVGYAGGSLGHRDGYGPAGVVTSTQDSGGSHGGPGGHGSNAGGGGVPGVVYDGVYRPLEPGSGGSYDGKNGGHGGGSLSLLASHLKLAGTVSADGAAGCASGSSGGGAGGALLVDVGTLSGAGTLSADGGNACSAAGAGGGGRIALHAGVVDGFDPAAQASARGGERSNDLYAAPGTVYWRFPGATHGVLRADNGLDGDDARVADYAGLTALGSGAVASLAGSGADAWLAAAAPFAAHWHGATVALLDGGGTVLGRYEVAEVGGDGRLLLAGAAGVAGAASYRGEYRFDRVELGPGAGLSAVDPVDADEVEIGNGRGFEGDFEVGLVDFAPGVTRLRDPLVAGSAVVRDGAVVVTESGTSFEITVTGTFTVESGGRISVEGRGYAAQQAPPGIAVPTGYATGGSHGGQGAGPSPGETFDSVYRPHYSGGGGSPGRWGAAPGGGILTISAGELVLDGQLIAQGSSYCGSGSGGGGSIRLDVGTASGSGTADAWGGESQLGGCIYSRLPGGGGRISLVADTLDGFDPAEQLRAWGGDDLAHTDHGGAGTAYYRLPEHTYGVLVVDNGLDDDGSVRETDASTVLPELPAGAVSALDVEGADAWLTGAAGFQGRWLGVWVVLADASGGDLGGFEVTAVDAAGRLRLAGAAGVVGAADYQGEYRFDAVEVRRGANLESPSRLVTADLVLDGGGRFGGDVEAGTLVFESGTVELTAPLVADNLTLKSGAALVPQGTAPLEIDVTGTLVIEAGAVVSASSRGYG